MKAIAILLFILPWSLFSQTRFKGTFSDSRKYGKTRIEFSKKDRFRYLATGCMGPHYGEGKYTFDKDTLLLQFDTIQFLEPIIIKVDSTPMDLDTACYRINLNFNSYLEHDMVFAKTFIKQDSLNLREVASFSDGFKEPFNISTDSAPNYVHIFVYVNNPIKFSLDTNYSYTFTITKNRREPHGLYNRRFFKMTINQIGKNAFQKCDGKDYSTIFRREKLKRKERKKVWSRIPNYLE